MIVLKKIALSSILLFLFAVPGWSWTFQETSQFREATENYRQSRFDRAIELFETLTAEHPHSATLFYNLGNSYFRKGQLGKALLAYERARMLEPRNRDIDFNLNYVRGFLEYRIEDKRNWYVRMGEKILEKFTEREIGLLTLGIYFLFMASWCFVLFYRRGSPWRWKRKTLLMLTVLCLTLVFAKHIETRVIRDAVVMAKETEVRYGPSETDQVAFRLSEGLKVYVIDQREDWSRIILVNGEGGWIKSDQIAKVEI